MSAADLDIARDRSRPMSERRAAAIRWLGPRWRLHPCHAPTRREVETLGERIARGLRSIETHASSIASGPPGGVDWSVDR